VTLGNNDKINDILNKNESVNLAFVCLGHGLIRDQHEFTFYFFGEVAGKS
jgi:hypothetical protein